MAITNETRTQLIALSVAMLGSAPGTDLLNQWVAAMLDDGMTLDEIAEHIATSDAFIATYPRFLSNEDFAESFLMSLMGNEEVPATLMAAAVALVTGLLNDGMSRAALALAAVGALNDIHMQGEDHPAYGDLGAVAMGFANKVEVAEYYTVDLRQAGSSSRVLHNVNSEMGLDDIRDSIGDYLDPPEPILLTSVRDNIVGTMAPDLIIAEPNSRNEDTLDPFDVIDGGGGTDTLQVYSGEGITIDVNGVDVKNVENVHLSARQAIDVDLTGWEGLEAVTLTRFGNTSDVSVTVNGATVSTARTFGGDVTLVGVAGDVDITAAASSAIKVGSGMHTTSVMTKGGASVDVNLNGAGGQSQTVTTVVMDGVKGEGLGGDGKRGNPMEEVGVTVRANNDSSTASDHTEANPQYVTSNGTAVANSATGFYKAASQTPDDGVTIAGLGTTVIIVTDTKADAEMREQVFVGGKRVDPGTADAVSGKDSGGVPIHINSDAIEHVSLSNTYATIAVINKSKEAEDLMVTVNKYGNSDVAGKFCITGDGAAENVSIMVAGDSRFDLANNVTKTVSISGAGDLTLGVTNFVAPPMHVNAGGDVTPAASATLESVTNSGSGKLTMNVAGTAKLKTIDGSASSGGSSITGVHATVEEVHGGSGNDAVTVAGFRGDGLTANLGAGNDTFTSAGGNGKSRVDGGEGMDVLHLTGASATHGTGAATASIFSNFEVLEVGGSDTATHDVKLLGVSAVSVSASTAGTVTLNNMADGMGLSVNGKAGGGTTATVVHDMADRKAGDARYSGVLDVSLAAAGSKTDAAGNGTGEAMLTLTVDEEIEDINVASSASAAGKASAAAYRNTFTLMGAHTGAEGSETAVASNVEVIGVTGNAGVTIMLANSTVGTAGDATQFAQLELIDAEANTGGVTFSADIAGDGSVVLAQKLTMTGGSGKDMFTGGAEADKLMGNGGDDTLNGGAEDDTITGGAGGDMLTGGTGDDTFKYGSASESQVVFGKSMSGFDTIADFGTGTDVISLGKTLFESLQGSVRAITGAAAIDSTDDDTDGSPTVNSLKAFLDGFKGDGVFETRGEVPSGNLGQGQLIKHSVATVTETYWGTAPVVDDPDTATDETAAGVPAYRKWILIDVDGDGDFDAGTDMVIALTETSADSTGALTASAFSA